METAPSVSMRVPALCSGAGRAQGMGLRSLASLCGDHVVTGTRELGTDAQPEAHLPGSLSLTPRAPPRTALAGLHQFPVLTRCAGGCPHTASLAGPPTLILLPPADHTIVWEGVGWAGAGPGGGAGRGDRQSSARTSGSRRVASALAAWVWESPCVSAVRGAGSMGCERGSCRGDLCFRGCHREPTCVWAPGEMPPLLCACAHLP